MNRNENKISGVLKSAESEEKYRLRRYFPNKELINFVEQFWFVDWHLDSNEVHVQKNLPDPNFHLIFENDIAKLIGPVSKVYNYEMKKQGVIYGIKFKLGALSELLDLPTTSYVDKEIEASEVFGPGVQHLMPCPSHSVNDEALNRVLQTFLTPFIKTPSRTQLQVQRQVALIKSNVDITSVEKLAHCSNTSVRTIQRHFLNEVGLSPKWLIRKYRLHKALEELDTDQVSVADIVEQLDYTDQSHLIRDFKNMLGITPNQYTS